MSITPKIISTIRQAGEAIDTARKELANALADHAVRVMSAIQSNPTSLENEKSMDDWKALAKLARELETAEQAVQNDLLHCRADGDARGSREVSQRCLEERELIGLEIST